MSGSVGLSAMWGCCSLFKPKGQSGYKLTNTRPRALSSCHQSYLGGCQLTCACAGRAHGTGVCWGPSEEVRRLAA